MVATNRTLVPCPWFNFVDLVSWCKTLAPVITRPEYMAIVGLVTPQL